MPSIGRSTASMLIPNFDLHCTIVEVTPANPSVSREWHQLDQQEDRLAALQKEVSDLGDKKEKADEELSQLVQSIALDESF
jgi:DNA repair ATPase RecN